MNIEAAKYILSFFPLIVSVIGLHVPTSTRATTMAAAAMASYNSVAPAHAINRLSIVNTALFHFPAILSPFCFRFLCATGPLVTETATAADDGEIDRYQNENHEQENFCFIFRCCCCCCCIECDTIRWKQAARV